MSASHTLAVLMMAMCRNFHVKGTIVDVCLSDTRNALHLQPPPHYIDAAGDKPDEKGGKDSQDFNDDDDDDDGNEDQGIDEEEFQDMDFIEIPVDSDEESNEGQNTGWGTGGNQRTSTIDLTLHLSDHSPIHQSPNQNRSQQNQEIPILSPEASTSPEARRLSTPFRDYPGRMPKPKVQDNSSKKPYGLRSQGEPNQGHSSLPRKGPRVQPSTSQSQKRAFIPPFKNSPQQPPSKKPKPFPPKRKIGPAFQPPLRSPPSRGAYFTSRNDVIERDPPLVIRYSNLYGRYCWYNSSMVNLIWLMKKIGEHYDFHFPDDAMEIPGGEQNFLNFLEQYYNTDENNLADPVPMMTAFIREACNSDMTILENTGFATEIFTRFSNNSTLERFFKFIRPDVQTTTKSSECSECDIEARESIAVNPMPIIEIRNLDSNLTVQDLIEEYFSNNFTVEEADCRMEHCDGKIQIESRNMLATHPQGLIIKLGVEGHDRNEAFINRQSIELGGDVRLTNTSGVFSRFSLSGAIRHTGTQVDDGHFFAYLKKPKQPQNIESGQPTYSWSKFNDANPILSVPERDVQKADIFFFVQVPLQSTQQWN